MDRPFSGKVLLVGEGDFSLSVSLVSMYPQQKLSSIVTTSIESDVSIQKHQGAMPNITILRQKGVTVQFCVDATELHGNSHINRMQFERIIFNFPHAGGKSNLKKNRKLLNDFFYSATQILEEKGQIMVTLCKGQGGTPADQPMRAWHDSWQVVSMAANAGLILTELVPFVSQNYKAYNSTGFRSQDKWFHTEGAITHIFEKADTVPVPGHQEITHYLDHKFKKNLHIQDRNPVCEVKKALEKVFCKTLKAKLLDPSLFPTEINNKTLLDLHKLTQEDEDFRSYTDATGDGGGADRSTWYYRFDKRCSADSKYSLVQPMLFSDQPCDEKEFLIPVGLMKSPQSVPMGVMEKMKATSHQENITEKHSGCSCSSADLSDLKIDSKQYLCTSLLECLPEILKLSDAYSLIYSDEVYRPCLIKKGSETVNYEMIAVFSMSCVHNMFGSNFPQGSFNVFESLKSLFSAISIELHANFVLSECENKHNCHKQDCLSLLATIHLSDLDTAKIVGRAWTLLSKDVMDTKLILIFDLILLSMHLYNIPHKQLLWSTDRRVVKQFCEKDSDWPKYIPVSLHPIEFSHDMSFWENNERVFDEIVYHDIIRNVGGDSIINVEMIDTYTDKETERTSRCYRLLFKSYDKALCYNTSWQIQSVIRLQVSKTMGIILR